MTTTATAEHRTDVTPDPTTGSWRWSCSCGDGSNPVLPSHAARDLARSHEQSANAPAIPDQPDGIEDDSYDLPDPHRAATRVRDWIGAWGDGLINTADGHPLYARDLEAICRAIQSPVDGVGELIDRLAAQLDRAEARLDGDAWDRITTERDDWEKVAARSAEQIGDLTQQRNTLRAELERVTGELALRRQDLVPADEYNGLFAESEQLRAERDQARANALTPDERQTTANGIRAYIRLCGHRIPDDHPLHTIAAKLSTPPAAFAADHLNQVRADRDNARAERDDLRRQLQAIRDARAHACGTYCTEGGCDFDLGGFVDRVDEILGASAPAPCLGSPRRAQEPAQPATIDADGRTRAGEGYAPQDAADVHLGDPAGYEIVATRLYRDQRGQLVSGTVAVASAVSTRPTLAEAVDELARIVGPAEQAEG